MTLGVSGLDQLPVPILVAPEVAQYLKPLASASRACIGKFDPRRKRLPTEGVDLMILPILGIDIAKLKFDVCLSNTDSKLEARSILAHLQGTAWLMASLLYESGLRLLECCTLRVKDFDFDNLRSLSGMAKAAKTAALFFPTHWSSRCRII